jgi:NAD(P)-dependent dehydrogenase (short-subunit alcohol dehydrogenase family)
MAVAVITGGSRGIGAVTAPLLAAAGLDICLSFRADEAAAEAVVEACLARDVQAVAVRCDVRDEDDVVALFEAADQLGSLRVLVNNAGITGPKARLDELTAARIEDLLAVNVLGSFLCAREAVRRLSTVHGGAGGVIVNVSSAAARLGSPGEYIDYAATKGAIDTMTMGLAKEVAREGIRVNAVRPGLIKTEIHASGGQPRRVEERRDTVPLGRGGEAVEVAHAIAWLCSDEASYVTGALLDVSGGR